MLLILQCVHRIDSGVNNLLMRSNGFKKMFLAQILGHRTDDC